MNRIKSPRKEKVQCFFCNHEFKKEDTFVDQGKISCYACERKKRESR